MSEDKCKVCKYDKGVKDGYCEEHYETAREKEEKGAGDKVACNQLTSV